MTGTAKVSIGANYSVNASIDDGAFTATVDTAVRDNDGNNVFDGSVSTTAGDNDADRKTTIEVSDSDLESAETSFEIKPSFTFNPESPTPGEDVTISLVDISGAPTSVTFTGAPIIMNVDAIVDSPAVVNIRDSDGDGTAPPLVGRYRFPVTRKSRNPDCQGNRYVHSGDEMILRLPRPSAIGTIQSLELQPQHRCPWPADHHPGQRLQVARLS